MVLKAIIYEADVQCPVKRFKVKTSRPEWLSLELLEMARDRDMSARLAKRKNDGEHWQILRDTRNEYNACLKNAKNDYIIEQLNRCLTDQNRFWATIKDILPNKSSKTVGQIKDPCSGVMLSPHDSVNTINTFFNEYGKKLCQSLPDCDRPYKPSEVNFCLNDFQPIESEKVRSYIDNIKICKSSGIHGISSRSLRDGLSAIPEQISCIFNLSLSTCIVPKCWKEAKVTPIPKKGEYVTSIMSDQLVKRRLLVNFWRNM